ncbi:MAG: hypothetical protein RR428_00765 [Coprobacillus sp.]
MRKKMIIMFGLIVLSLVGVLCTVRFYNINDTENYSSVKIFEKETKLKFYDIYDINSYVFSGNKVKLSNISNLQIMFDKTQENHYRVSIDSTQSIYEIDINLKTNLPTNYKSKTIDDITLHYLYMSQDQVYEFVVNENNVQYKFNLKNTDNLSEENLFLKVKDYILLNKELF